MKDADAMLGLCLLLWCLGPGVAGSERVTFTHDIKDDGRTQRILAFDLPWLTVGFVEQTTARDGVFGGVTPLKVNALHGYVLLEGGALVASTAVPDGGTHANFTARAQLRLTGRVALAYWHWSNASLGRRNPAVDSLGVTVQLRTR